MALVLNGSANTIGGLAVGGVPDGTIDADALAANSVTDAKLNISGEVKAWIKFNGTGTIAITASYNVTSITDNGTGDYTITFTNNMSDANYVISGACKEDLTGNGRGQVFMAAYRHAAVVGSLRVNSMLSETGNVFDSAEVHVIVHR